MSNLEYVTKRLHVSGLTPQISDADIKARFSSFGNVKALDGLGKLDALGQPRPFAYVTLETTKQQLAKCLNLLSGTTWKGAKLRIGEAKPDFRERILKENEAADDTSPRPTKRRRLMRGTQGMHASDMSLVTPDSVRAGWRITPLGRLVRPMRIRPLRPLPSKPSVTTKAEPRAQRVKKARKKKSMVLVRARRKKIDPEEWGSTYLSGIMLESGSRVILPERNPGPKPSEAREVHRKAAGMDEAKEEMLDALDDNLTDDAHQTRSRSPSSSSTLSEPYSMSARQQATRSPATKERAPVPQVEAKMNQNLAEEKARSLALLTSLFGSANTKRNGEDEDWGTTESISDLDLDVQAPVPFAAGTLDGDDDGIEYVPRIVANRTYEDTQMEEEASVHDEEMDVPVENTLEKETGQDEQAQKQSVQAEVQLAKLKDMFAPRPEDAGFSILNNLDLDLELDEDFLPASAPPPPPPQAAPVETSLSVSTTPFATPRYSSTITLDPKRPFFFPHSLLSSHSSHNLKPGDPRDIFSKSIDFYRTESEEEIRRKWEERKVELTREWKRRHREAVKSARRRGAAQD